MTITTLRLALNQCNQTMLDGVKVTEFVDTEYGGKPALRLTAEDINGDPDFAYFAEPLKINVSEQGDTRVQDLRGSLWTLTFQNVHPFKPEPLVRNLGPFEVLWEPNAGPIGDETGPLWFIKVNIPDHQGTHSYLVCAANQDAALEFISAQAAIDAALDEKRVEFLTRVYGGVVSLATSRHVGTLS